ncbi:hypothetical protein ORI89_05885 [Sphingobacterium sp. UT-1RO-CII-1]|uniref:hypothetical protein n=1 Tax=Sphingobacterium sp. UT-1RO-CII-1 TaxID=2995225 RepID=UPI00227BC1D3|nr:hypothetical protein [Sphingobacterium sp. UT-1RO-CII-1]MCY4779171.1 hypothetical protein [Sphingobacterium sp. UT-1RO-CII-1]
MWKIFEKHCIVFLVVFLLYGCDFIRTSISDTYKENKGDSSSFSHLSIEKIKNLMREGRWDGKVNLFSRPDWWEDAQHGLHSIELLKERPLFFYKTIHFYSDGRIGVKIQNPDNEGEIDSYWYIKGEWKDKAPVKLNVATKPQASLSALKNVNFSDVAEIYNLVTSDREEPAESIVISHMYLTQHNKKDNKLIWRGSLSTERKLLNFSAEVSQGKSMTIQY